MSEHVPAVERDELQQDHGMHPQLVLHRAARRSIELVVLQERGAVREHHLRTGGTTSKRSPQEVEPEQHGAGYQEGLGLCGFGGHGQDLHRGQGGTPIDT